MKNKFAAIFLYLLIFCFCTTCYAEGDTTSPYASELIASVTTGLRITDNVARATVSVNAHDPSDKVGITTFKIQEKRNGTWFTVASVTTQYNTNTNYYNYTLTYSNVTEGMQYRATATGFVTDGSTTHTRSSTSTKTA